MNCLAPGRFRTEQNKDGAIVFLASDASAYITGQTLLVNGGISTGATRVTATPRKRRT